MHELSTADEKRLDEVQWLCGAFLRGVQIDWEQHEVSIFAAASRELVEILCQQAAYADIPNLFDAAETPRIVGLVVQPLDDSVVVRLEFSNRHAHLHLRCQAVSVRTSAL